MIAHDDDECDSSSPLTIASQTDMNSFLHAQATKIMGLNSNLSGDDENSMDEHLFARFAQSSSKFCSKSSYLSHSCFASISSPSSTKPSNVDDLTELKWLSTYKLKDLTANPGDQKDRISQLSHELQTSTDENRTTDSMSLEYLVFLALYTKRDDPQTPWSLTVKQLYEYIEKNTTQRTMKRGWKNSLKEALVTIPCFIQTKVGTMKSRSMWTIDTYYRPLLTRAYLSGLNKTTSTKSNDVQRSSESIEDHFAPKATVKTKVLPRLYELLCEEKLKDDETDLKQPNPTAVVSNKRPRSISSSSVYRQSIKDNDSRRLSSSSPWITKSKYNATQPPPKTTIITPSPSTDHIYLNSAKKPTIEQNETSPDEDDECDSSLSTIQTRSRSISIHRRKSSLPKKHPVLLFPSHRANTRISRKIIEQDLQLLRQGNIPPSIKASVPNSITSFDGVLDLSLAR